jgi:YesN/AraC family two-component response regulator
MVDLKLLTDMSHEMNVLYVEDNEDVRNSTADMLKDLFNSIETAVDGKDGLEKYIDYHKQNEKYFDIVISDINMPTMNGIDMSRHVLGINSIQEIIIISAHNESTYLFDLINIGVSSFLLKPLHLEQLFTVLLSVTTSIHNRKFKERYYEKVESLNGELYQKNEELERSLRVANTLAAKNSYLTPALSTSQKDIEKELRDQNELALFKTDTLSMVQILQSKLSVDIMMLISSLQKDETLNKILLIEFVKSWKKYLFLIKDYTIFENATLTLESLSNLLAQDDFATHADLLSLLLLIESLVFMLERWQRHISEESLQNITIIEANIASDVQSILNLYSGTFEAEASSFIESLTQHASI